MPVSTRNQARTLSEVIIRNRHNHWWKVIEWNSNEDLSKRQSRLLVSYGISFRTIERDAIASLHFANRQ